MALLYNISINFILNSGTLNTFKGLYLPILKLFLPKMLQQKAQQNQIRLQ